MTALVLILASFVAWFFSMLAGGGSPLILIPLISLMLGAQAVAPVITVGLLMGNGQRSLVFWRDIDWQVTGWYAPGALLGGVLGAYVLSRMHLEWLQPVIAIGLVGIGINYWLSQQETTFTVKGWFFLPLSFLNAVGSAVIGSTGPIMNPLYLNYGLDKEAMIATKSLNKSLLHLIKIAAYGILGELSWEHVGYGLVIGLGAIPANWLGKHVLARMSNHQFRQLAFTFVAVSGMFMLWQQRRLLFFVG
ncbi:sulfite exporter TauE/SafE family protein [filamentous cyanobacterium CCP5]|nr:sulfite exporter TauE/SafE family protein [filamentous cyanobacterium CCP5]